MAAQPADVDDFGLPIRRFPTPKNDAPVDKDTPETSGSKVESDPASDKELESTGEKAPAAADAHAAKRDDDGDALKDARSEQESTPQSPSPSKQCAVQEPTKSDDVKLEDAKPKDVKLEGVKLEDVELEDVKLEDVKLEDVKLENTKPEVTEPEVITPEITKPEITKPEVTKPEATKPEHTKPEPTEHETTDPGSPAATEPSKPPLDIPSSKQKTDPEVPAESPLPVQSSDPKPDSDTPAKVSHKREISDVVAEPRAGVSEFSHQHISTAPEPKDEKKDEAWQEMPAYARFDMYDDDDRLVAKEFNPEEEETYGYAGLGGAGKGYTRVLLDDDAESATSMDENTNYLFKQVNGTSAVEDDEGRDAVSQMQATKDLLTEGQRIAYVGVVRLEIANMVEIEEKLEKTRSTKKVTAMAAEAMKMWGQKMMIRLYTHMDISEAEQIMIEQLAEHGVIPADLTPTLTLNSRVHNPMAEDKSSNRSSLSSPGLQSPSEEEAAQPPPPYEAPDGEELPDVKTPSQLPTTDKIDIDLRWTILCDLFLVLIADSVYDSRSRVLLERSGKSLEISWIDICRFEKKVTDALEMQQAAEKENWNEDEHMEIRRKEALKRRYVMMGLATVGGGLVIGLSAGLLAPVIGAGLVTGLTAIGVTGTSGFLGGVGGAAIITSGAAASGSIIGGKAAARRTGAVKTFEYRPLHNNKRVNLIVTISGWLTGKVDDVRLPFSTVDPIMGDIYSVLWEPEMLRSIGDTINILATEALTQGLQQVLASTILAGLMSAIQLPIILTKLSYLIDNPWAVSLDRAWAAGKILADSLIERNLGTRPITLVGYSIGARVIFSCLLELAKKSAYGIVQNVYMFGCPIVVKKDEYLKARTVVSGRFLNAYNRNDWILGYLFRLTNGGIRRIAGLAPVDDCPFVENMDVTDMVVGHMDYRTQMPSMLMKCGWSVESEEFAEIEDPDPENHGERQRELINEIEEARKQLEKEGNASTAKSSRFSIFGRRKKLEKQDWEIYEDTLGKSGKTDGKADGKGVENEKGEGNNQGVLFDVDAIRAEISAEISKEARYDTDDNAEEFQVREIKSTLPPMKLDISSLPTSPSPSAFASRSGENLASRSGENLATRDSYETRISREPSPSYVGHGRPPAYPEDMYEDDVHMTFDTSFEDSPRAPTVPPKDTTEMAPAPNRPEYKTSQTMPAMTLHDPWGDEDADFGKEKEISMTFA
ncbi:hypothetical protein G7Z17_g13166 [Cylindrodendrum hubeiense]|uniref:DUF726-domain-containing protein n=1 Tax=Cylindrodendrum hubeiense TaxID=595255 RepID=A0A9P5H0H5_9HYPO|nr:hypothetical protein G7Z17_g13166 [Cylindrodendrum hubeiense]